jgi:FKBP-type peptidyl-prolyl cis-trans isomerase
MKKLLLLAIIGSLFVGTAFVQNKATTTKSGLKYVDIKVGTGDEAKMGMNVDVRYTGWLYVKGKRHGKFGASGDRGGILSFRLGTGRVVAGLEEGISGMKVGGKRELFVPPELGYGASGSGRVIPANATLDFEVELVRVSK